MKRFTFKKDGSNCISSRGMCIYGGYNKGEYIYIGEPVDTFAKYEDLDERIQNEFGLNASVYDLFDVFIKQLEDKDGEPLKGFRLLTNDDAKLYDEWKRSMNE